MKCEGVGFDFFFNGADVQVLRNGNFSFGKVEEVIDGLHASGSERFAGLEFRWLNLCSEFGELRLAVTREAVKNIGQKYRNELRQSVRVGRLHVFDAGIV